MKISMSGIMFDGAPLEECIEGAARIGYDGIELRGKPRHLGLEMKPAEFAAVKKRIRDAGLAVTGIASFTGNYALLDKGECKKQYDDFVKYAQMAAELDCGVVRHWAGWKPSAEATDEEWSRAAEWMAKAADAAAAAGVKVALELHHGTLVDTYARALALYREIGRDNVGFIHDAVNLYHDDQDYGYGQMPVLRGLLLTVHMKDVVRLQDASNSAAYNYKGKFYRHCLIGQGGVDQMSVLMGLKRIGYDGYLTVESSSLLTPYELAEHSCRILGKLSGEVFGQ